MSDPQVPSLVRAFYANRRARMGPLEARAIGTICSTLEAYNHKRALLLLDQRLKTNAADPACLALKALALYLTSKPLPPSIRQDILAVVETVKTAKKGAALGDADVILFPDNEELSMEAFLGYIRVGEKKGAQQLSMEMSKRFKGDHYLWWSLLSTILQIRDLSNPHPDADLLLSLGEQQLSARYADVVNAPSDAHASSKPDPRYAFTSADEFHVATRILELRAQYAALKPADIASTTSAPIVLPSLPPDDTPRSPAQALLAHFASPAGEKWCQSGLGFELWKREAMLQYGTVEGKDWEALWERLAATLEKGDTNWHTMLYLVRAAFSLAAGSSSYYFAASSSSEATTPSPAGLELISRSRELLRKLATSSPKAKVERGFVLGLLEIAREARSRGWEEADQFLTLVEEYFDRFAGKMCCFDDLTPYLAVLSDSESSSLREKLDAQAAEAKLASPSDATRCINALKVARYLGEEPAVEGEVKAADSYLRRYFEALPLDDRSFLERALVVSESALQHSKQKYQLRILTSNLLRLLGAPSASLAHYRSFGVKNIQHDTLSHLVLSRGATFAIEGNVGKEGGVFEHAAETERWYRGGVKEAQEMVVRALTSNTYSKVEDFSEFRLRLENSLQKSLVTVEALRMRVIRGVLDSAGTEVAVETIAKLIEGEQGFSDNRDYKTLPNFQRKGEPTIWEQTELSQRQDADWLRALATVYARFLRPSIEVRFAEPPSSLTRSEVNLLHFSEKAQAVLVADLNKAAEAEQAGLAFFKDKAALFVSASEGAKTLPWELLQIAEVALEAFSLLELGIEQRLAEMAAGKLPDQPRHTKRLRAFRANARDLVRSTGAKLTAYSKKVAKERAKIVAAMGDLRQFDEFDENRLTNVAHALVESKKTAAEALGQAIHRRCVK
ncbi:mitochondrial distribution and morphology [Rhodosporidiobolus nylandii]